MKRSRGPYKQYTVNGIPRRTEYRERKRLLLEVSEQLAQADCELIAQMRPELPELRRDIEKDEVCAYIMQSMYLGFNSDQTRLDNKLFVYINL